MRYGHRRVIPQVTAVDELFGTHRVADESTAILMRTFYDLWRGGGLPIPHALAAAQRALRTMTNAELLASYPALFTERAGQVPTAHRHLWESAHRYNDPTIGRRSSSSAAEDSHPRPRQPELAQETADAARIVPRRPARNTGARIEPVVAPSDRQR
jgi:hypothetical protein